MINERNNNYVYNLYVRIVYKEVVEGQNVKMSRQSQWQQAQCQRRKDFFQETGDPPLMVFVT